MPSRSARAKRPGEATPSAATGPTVAEVYDALDELAPFSGAASWDNVGLIAGRLEWPARRVLLAIDLTDAVAREALNKNVDALVTYHPPIFKGIHTVSPDAEAPTALLADLLAARISILSVHTALDSAVGGTNDILLDIFSPQWRFPLEMSIDEGRSYKLAVFVPPDEAEELRTALSEAGAGAIGDYTECSFELRGRGTFVGGANTRPTLGRKLNLETVDEVRLEMIVPRCCVGEVVRALYENHSYDEPAFDLVPLHDVAGRGAVGLGRVGVFEKPRRGSELLERLRDNIDLSIASVVGELKRSFGSVTAAAGSFGVRAFCDRDSLVLTGEFKHHEALDLLRRGVSAVRIGHDASERPALRALRERLASRLPGLKASVARTDRSPLRPVD